MNFELLPATQSHQDIISNLMQFYIYDFSEYVDCDPEETGLFKPYDGLEAYWKEEADKFPYIIKKDKNYIVFALVKRREPERNCFSIAEFFILKRYAGKELAML